MTQSVIRWRGTKFWGLGKHEGTVEFHSGVLCVRGGAVVSGWFEADMTTIDVTDIPTHEPVPRQRLLKHLASDDFFHVAAYPRAGFVLQSVEHESNRLYRVVGDLTIRGHTHPVTFYARGWSITAREVRAEARLRDRPAPIRRELPWLDDQGRPGGRYILVGARDRRPCQPTVIIGQSPDHETLLAQVREIVSLYDAKTNLSSLVERAAAGEEIVITKSGKPKALLVPIADARPQRTLGKGRGKWRVRDDFDAPLPPDVLADFGDPGT